ncbi:hypothetical protein BWQ96_02259 [Gracilariopsis chorda]|uniref:F-box domain-containing protein n=1 Tax=Gracilariopsis chorda TaxID=448386 RepID=A0A2V3J0N9_9FLOR|nr:hypothetical protein BWQ96_02259 [Gracilariopsis chorda]|eukprot:PXF47873.1 hypothetical protein BWQ96_02259 [Gracilariopsis chorda]
MTGLENDKSTCLPNDDIWFKVFGFLSSTDLRFVAQVGSSFRNTAKAHHRLARGSKQAKNASHYFIHKEMHSTSFNSDGTLLAYWDDEDKEFAIISVKRSIIVSRIKAFCSRPDVICFSQNSEYLAALSFTNLLVFRICPPRGKHGFQELERIRKVDMNPHNIRTMHFSKGDMNPTSIKLAEFGLTPDDDTLLVSFMELNLHGNNVSCKPVVKTVRFSPTFPREPLYCDLRDISFSTSPARLYVSPAGLRACSGQLFGTDQGCRRPVPLHSSRLGVLMGATLTPCGTYFVELRRLRSAYILRKVDTASFKGIDTTKVERHEDEALLGFMASDCLVLVLLGSLIDDELHTEARKCRVSGWVVYDTRSSQAVFTTMKKKRKEIYQAETESIVLSQDGQLLGLVPVRRNGDQDCELQIFYVSTGWLKQTHKRAACSKKGMHTQTTIQSVKCTCLSLISTIPETSVSTVSVGRYASTVIHSS